jgi:O-antigen ligase
MIAWLRWALLVWIAICPVSLLNLYRVRNSGIYFPVLCLSVFIALTAVHVWRRPQDCPWRSRLFVPLVALAVTAVLAGLTGALIYDRTVLGAHRYALVQVYAVALVLLSIGAALTVSVLIRTEHDIRWVRRAVIVAALLILADDVVKLPLSHVAWWPLVTTHAVAMVLAALFYERDDGRVVLPGLLFVVVIVDRVILNPFLSHASSQWLSGWIALGTPVALLLLVRFPRTSLGLVLPATVLFLVWNIGMLQHVFEIARREGDFGRLVLWRDAIEVALLRPFLGIGPGNYLDYTMRYGDLGLWLSSPHGNYQQIAAEMGFVGLGFMLWLVIRSFTLGWRLYRGSDGFRRSIAIAITCSIAGPLMAAIVGDFVIPNYHNGGYINLSASVYAWVMLGVLMSLERLSTESPAATAAPVSALDSNPASHGS